MTFDTMAVIEAELDWDIDDGDYISHGTDYDYIIDLDNELAVFNGSKCIAVRECVDEEHAQFIAEAFEIERKRDLLRGETWRGKPVY